MPCKADITAMPFWTWSSLHRRVTDGWRAACLTWTHHIWTCWMVEWVNLPLRAKQMLRRIASIPACASWMLEATRADYLLLKASTTAKCNVNVCFGIVSPSKNSTFSILFLADLTLQPQLTRRGSTKSALLSAVWRPKKDADGWSVKLLPSQSPINPEDIPSYISLGCGH